MHPDLIVIYTDRLDACHAFYTELGLTFVKEQHGPGPEHYAIQLEGTALELYPASPRRPATGSLHLGLTIPASPRTPPSAGTPTPTRTTAPSSSPSPRRHTP